VLEPKRRFHLWTLSAAFGFFVVGLIMLHAAAKANQREFRMVERIRPICVHDDFSNEEMHRLVRFEYGAWPTKEEAIRAVVRLCRRNVRRNTAWPRRNSRATNSPCNAEYVAAAIAGVPSARALMRAVLGIPYRMLYMAHDLVRTISSSPSALVCSRHPIDVAVTGLR
jgi:hypothetical protein